MTTRETLTFARTFKASPDRVFAALIEPAARKVWGVPGDGYRYVLESATTPAAGQREIGLITGDGEDDTEIVTDWILLDPGARVVYAEALVHGGMTLGLSFAEAELSETDQGCDMQLHVHVTGYAGPEVIAEMQAGWDHAVAALVLYLTENQAT